MGEVVQALALQLLGDEGDHGRARALCRCQQAPGFWNIRFREALGFWNIRFWEALGFWNVRFQEAPAAVGAELTRTCVFWF